TNNRPIAIIRRSCSDSPPAASQMDGVFRSESYIWVEPMPFRSPGGRDGRQMHLDRSIRHEIHILRVPAPLPSSTGVKRKRQLFARLAIGLVNVETGMLVALMA